MSHVYDVEMSTISGKTCTTLEAVNFVIQSSDGNGFLQLNNVFTRKTLNIRNTGTGGRHWEHLQDVSSRVSDLPVELLIGQDTPDALQPLEIVSWPPGASYAMKTIFGWTVCGPTCQEVQQNVQLNFISLEEQVKKMWELENPTMEYNLSSIERKVVQCWNENTTMVDGHITMKIPFKTCPPPLEDNKTVAERRLRSLGKRLSKDEGLKEKYVDKVTELLYKG